MSEEIIEFSLANGNIVKTTKQEIFVELVGCVVKLTSLSNIIANKSENPILKNYVETIFKSVRSFVFEYIPCANDIERILEPTFQEFYEKFMEYLLKEDDDKNE